jgi:hypothetical protein
MALPLSGPLSMGDIRTELGIPNVSNFSLINSTSGVSPYPPINQNSTYKPIPPFQRKISEWYGYNHASVTPFIYYQWMGQVVYFTYYDNNMMQVPSPTNLTIFYNIELNGPPAIPDSFFFASGGTGIRSKSYGTNIINNVQVNTILAANGMIVDFTDSL